MTEPGQRPDPSRASGARRSPPELGDELRAAHDKAEAEATALARYRGHDPHGFVRTSTTSRTACRRCGAGIFVELRAVGETIAVATSGAGVELDCRTAPRAAIDVTDPRD